MCTVQVSAILQLVDEDLGYSVPGVTSGEGAVQAITARHSRAKFFLFISADKRVVGFCAAQVISKVFLDVLKIIHTESSIFFRLYIYGILAVVFCAALNFQCSTK